MSETGAVKRRFNIEEIESLQSMGDFTWRELTGEEYGGVASAGHGALGYIESRKHGFAVRENVMESGSTMPTLVVRLSGATPNVIVERPEFSKVRHLIDCAVEAFAPVPSIRALYVQVEEGLVTIISVVEPWTAEARSQVFRAELVLKERCPRASIYFEAVRSELLASLEGTSKLVFKK